MLNWKELAPEVHHFEFEIPGVQRFVFTPGQYIPVLEPVVGGHIVRPYSIASPRDGNRFSLCLNHIPGGPVSTYLFDLKPGDEVEIEAPLGEFTFRHADRPAIFIATGTGIAPFRSMLLDHVPRTHPPMTLLFGVRYEAGLLYREEFQELAAQYPSFHFLPTITRPGENWNGFTGRVQAHIDDALALYQPDEASHADVYVCGLKEMVEDVRAELLRRGFDAGQVICEEYD